MERAGVAGSSPLPGYSCIVRRSSRAGAQPDAGYQVLQEAAQGAVLQRGGDQRIRNSPLSVIWTPAARHGSVALEALPHERERPVDLWHPVRLPAEPAC